MQNIDIVIHFQMHHNLFLQVHYLDYIVVTFDQGLRYPSTDYVQSKVTKEMNSGKSHLSISVLHF